MKYYTMGFSLILISFIAILMLQYFGELTLQVKKDIDITRSEINNLNEKIQINELEYTFLTSSSYLKNLEQLYLVNNYNETMELNIFNIHEFKTKNKYKIFKVKEN